MNDFLLQRRAFLFLASSLVAISCGGQPDDAPDGGSVNFTMVSSRPTTGSSTGASYARVVSFTRPECATTKVGACTLNPCFVASPSPGGSEPLPNAGQVTLGGAEMDPLALVPRSDGSYATSVVEGGVPWRTGGETVTVQWASLPGNAAEPGGTITLSTPHYIALVAGSAFADTMPTLLRTQDLTVSWTSDSSPAGTDDVMVNLVSGSTQVDCKFSASAGVGIVPAAALQSLEAGAGTYDVHSKAYGYENVTTADGAKWDLGLNVDAYARTSYGLAKGSVTIQ